MRNPSPEMFCRVFLGIFLIFSAIALSEASTILPDAISERQTTCPRRCAPSRQAVARLCSGRRGCRVRRCRRRGQPGWRCGPRPRPRPVPGCSYSSSLSATSLSATCSCPGSSFSTAISQISTVGSFRDRTRSYLRCVNTELKAQCKPGTTDVVNTAKTRCCTRNGGEITNFVPSVSPTCQFF